MKIPATVIWYNPDDENIKNIRTYIDYVEKLYIIDNSKENNKKLADSLNNLKAEYICNNKNLKNDIDKFSDVKESAEVDHVMTSGNLLNLKIWEEIGRFDENLFIDEVDSEICFRIIENGYKVIQLNKIRMFHELGNLEKKNFFTRKISVLNHNHIRKYYIMRNKFYMLKKYKKYRSRYIYYILNDFFKVIFYEKDKLRKLKYMFKGIADFMKSKMGELDDGK